MSPLESFLERHKEDRIVFTNGCFDILHAGHITYLNEARSLGDVLVVGLNSDSSIKRLKGDKRPILPEQERKFILENLKSVDHVELFYEDTPYDLIKKINPSILVKGGDWTPDQIVGSDIVLSAGGEVRSLIFVDGHSTTNIVEKIVATYSK